MANAYLGKFTFELDLPIPYEVGEVDCYYDGKNIIYTFGNGDYGPFNSIRDFSLAFAEIIFTHALEISDSPDVDETTANNAYSIIAVYKKRGNFANAIMEDMMHKFEGLSSHFDVKMSIV